MSETLFRSKDVCELLSCSRVTLWRMTRNGLLPIPTRIGRSNYWRAGDIHDFIAEKVAATPPKRPRRLSKREQAAQIAEHAREPKRRKGRDNSAVIPDSAAVTADSADGGPLDLNPQPSRTRNGGDLRINGDYFANDLSEADRARLDQRLRGGGASTLRWRL